MNNSIKNIYQKTIVIALYVIGIITAGSIIYGGYWIGKTSSYSFFYEDMVKKTIIQTVKPDALK
jgi:hypothetical protein